MASHGVPRVAASSIDKSEAAKEKERQRIEQYLDLEQQVSQKIKAGKFSIETLLLTTALLRQNPEYYTIWNHRRLILRDAISKELQAADADRSDAEIEAAREDGMTVQQNQVFLIVKEDLQFLVPLLRQFPKCYWIWNHRAWLLSEITQQLPQQVAIESWQGELGLVTKMLALDNRNFHGWDYRRKAVGEIERLTQQSLVPSEMSYTTQMINSNLSNFSAWHNRSQLLPRLLDESESTASLRRKHFDEEFELITTALYTDPYDQSLWFYHQYLMSTLDAEAPTNSAKYNRRTTILDPLTDEERLTYLEQEIRSIKDMLDGAEDCKYIYQALVSYSMSQRQLSSKGNQMSKTEIAGWLAELKRIDPLRQGRWLDVEKQLDAA